MNDMILKGVNSPRLRRLDPNNDAEMDRYNEEYIAAVKSMGICVEREYCTFEQAATYLGLSKSSVTRMVYGTGGKSGFELVRAKDENGKFASYVSLSTVVEYKMTRQARR